MAQGENYFDVDQSAAGRLNEGMALGGGIELPFSAPVFWWMNGNAQARAVAPSTPALYYGGWAANAESILDVQDERGAVPNGLVPTDIYTRDGKEIQAYTSRLLVVAPISFRQAWVISQGQQTAQRSTGYVAGARQHIQVLALMGFQRPDKTYQSWGPIVLSAKGYQAAYLQSAMKDWKKVIDKGLTQMGANPKPPAWAFWAGIGTFGDKINTQNVGKNGAQSPVTPLNLFVPKEITSDLLRRLYVGRDGVTEMASLLDEAGEWLGAWKNAESNHPNGGAAGPIDDGYIPPEPNFADDDIPF